MANVRLLREEMLRESHREEPQYWPRSCSFPDRSKTRGVGESERWHYKLGKQNVSSAATRGEEEEKKKMREKKKKTL